MVAHGTRVAAGGFSRRLGALGGRNGLKKSPARGESTVCIGFCRFPERRTLFDDRASVKTMHVKTCLGEAILDGTFVTNVQLLERSSICECRPWWLYRGPVRSSIFSIHLTRDTETPLSCSHSFDRIYCCMELRPRGHESLLCLVRHGLVGSPRIRRTRLAIPLAHYLRFEQGA